MLLANGSSVLPLSLSQVHATTTKMFWNVVEIADAYGLPVVLGAEQYIGTEYDDYYRLMLPPHPVFILPRATVAFGGLTPVTPKHADIHKWNLTSVVGMVDGFLQMTASSSVPSIKEYSLLPDKVKASVNVTVNSAPSSSFSQAWLRQRSRWTFCHPVHDRQHWPSACGTPAGQRDLGQMVNDSRCQLLQPV